MNDIRKLIKNIDRGVNLKRDLPIYSSIVSDTYMNYAAIDLAFSAYLLSETIMEYDNISDNERKLYYEVMSQLRIVIGDQAAEQGLPDKVRELRAKVTAVMEVFTSYTDQLICYEYVLERMALRFSTDKDTINRIKSIDEEDFLQRLMSFVVGYEDQSIVKEHLQILVKQIPVHMTKNKFLERVSEAVTLYKGSDMASLDGFAYMVRSAAMLHRPDDRLVSDERIREFLKTLENTDFSSLDEENYSRLCDELERTGEKILCITDFYYSMQKVVNGIYALFLCRLHNEKESGVYLDCVEILREVADGKHREESLVKLEGKIEEYVEKSSYLEAVLFETRSSCRELLEELGIFQNFEDYAVIANLLSDSLFIDIDQIKNEEKVDESKMKKVTAELTGELSDLLGTLKKPVKKAVMAAVLEKLPAGFSNTSEIEEYIRTNLFGCQDFSEKGVVMLEFEEMMAEALDWRD